ncbi:MAG: hypothetical protein ACLS63_04510 [Flavonifractor plautii]
MRSEGAHLHGELNLDMGTVRVKSDVFAVDHKGRTGALGGVGFDMTFTGSTTSANFSPTTPVSHRGQCEGEDALLEGKRT